MKVTTLQKRYTGSMIYTKIRWMNGTQDTEFEETFRMCGNWQKVV